MEVNEKIRNQERMVTTKTTTIHFTKETHSQPETDRKKNIKKPTISIAKFDILSTSHKKRNKEGCKKSIPQTCIEVPS